MMNILPPKEQMAIRREYLARLTIVFLIFCAATFAMASLLLVPRYFALNEQEKNLDSYIEIIKSGDDASEILLSEVEKVSKQIALLSLNESRLSIYEGALGSIMEARGGVNITSFLYEEAKDDVGTVRLEGRAPDRNELLEFTKRLKNNPLFYDVNVPVSDFVDNIDIKFSIDMHIKI